MVRETTPTEFYETVQRGEDLLLIDVRTPGEFNGEHAEMAVNLPLDQVTPDAVARVLEGRTPYFICQGGNRSKRACEALGHALGVEPVSVAGGTAAWVAAGLPAKRGKGVISIERQVRIGAGSLVALGTLLGAALHPAWLLLPGFVGLGLVFAGVTDTCGMAMLLARMPWNRGSGASAAGQWAGGS